MPLQVSERHLLLPLTTYQVNKMHLLLTFLTCLLLTEEPLSFPQSTADVLLNCHIHLNDLEILSKWVLAGAEDQHFQEATQGGLCCWLLWTVLWGVRVSSASLETPTRVNCSNLHTGRDSEYWSHYRMCSHFAPPYPHLPSPCFLTSLLVSGLLSPITAPLNSVSEVFLTNKTHVSLCDSLA